MPADRLHCEPLSALEPDADARLRALFRETPSPGAMRLAFTREPALTRPCPAEGEAWAFWADAPDGAVLGAGLFSVSTAWADGRPIRRGYLGGLRIRPGHRGGTWLARGYRRLRDRFADRWPDLVLTTILDGNPGAERLLTSGRAGLPVYRPAGTVHTMIYAPRRASSPPLSVRPAVPGDLPALRERIRDESWTRWGLPGAGHARIQGPGDPMEGVDPRPGGRDDGADPPPSDSAGRVGGHALSDLLVAEERDDLAACATFWDPTPWRQVVVDGYRPTTAWLRHPINLISRVRGRPVLPRPGAVLPLRSLAPLTGGHRPEAFRDILRAALGRAAEARALVMLALHERDPLLPIARLVRHLDLTSRLYTVDWKTTDTPGLPDPVVPHLDAGLL